MDEHASGVAEPVEAPVHVVELFEDRAGVTRSFRIPGEGRHRLRIGPLTPLVDVRRITFPRLAEGLVVEEVLVHREPVEAEVADPAEVERLSAELAQAREAREAQADTVRRAREANLRARQASQAAQSASVRALQEHDDVQAWTASVETLARHQGKTLRDVAEAELELTRLTEHETELARTLDGLRRGGSPALDEPLDTSEVVAGAAITAEPELQGWIELAVLARGACEQHVRYVVPCALWRPTHHAQLVSGSGANGADHIQWSTSAACWNHTGESWEGVRIVCSTARDGHRAQPPVIRDDVIRLAEAEVTGALPSELPDDPSEELFGGEHEPGVRVAADLPGADDGGSARLFEVEGTVTLPSHGRAVVVPLESWSVDAMSDFWSVPEHAPLVVRRTHQVNGAGGPLLAGPVHLARGGTLVGRGVVHLVPEGAPFLLEWGHHPDLRVQRKRETEIARQKATGTLTRTFRVAITVRNHSDATRTVALRERVPISEYSDVFVSRPETEPAAPMDPDGFCDWVVELEPGATAPISLVYTVRAAADADLPFTGP